MLIHSGLASNSSIHQFINSSIRVAQVVVDVVVDLGAALYVLV